MTAKQTEKTEKINFFIVPALVEEESEKMAYINIEGLKNVKSSSQVMLGALQRRVIKHGTGLKFKLWGALKFDEEIKQT